MSRLWSRFGVRSLAIGLLGLSLAGGYWLSADRQTQQRAAALDQARQDDRDDVYQQKLDAQAQWRAAAAQRAAQAAAKAQADAAAKAAADQARAADEAARKQAASRGAARPPATPGVPVPSSCAQFSGNQALACAILPEFGFGIAEMSCLVPMWNKESSWNERERNPSSGAYGIPQAVPATKMAAYGADYLTNPVPQIRWGLSYLKGRYGSPCNGWAFWQKHGWY